MNVIRDEELNGLGMIPLFFSWGIRRCNMKDCKNKPSTIIANTLSPKPFGLCEDHYQQGVKEGTMKMVLEFDNFDAFDKSEVK